MNKKSETHRLLILPSLVIFILLAVGISQSQVSAILDISVPDTTAQPGETGLEIPVYFKNYQDTVAGFALWFQLSESGKVELRPDIVTEGTLIENWEYVESRSVSGQPLDVRVAAIANLPAAPTTPGIAPQIDDIPLLILVIDVDQIPDSTTDRTVNININDDQLFNFNFSDPSGYSIGTIRDSVLDTAYYVCNLWDGDTCLDWEVYYEPQGENDSIVPYWNYYSYLDSANVYVSDGSITITGGYVCGDINNSGAGPDISDLVYLVTWMFSQGPPPPVMSAGNVNGEGSIDISDLVYLVNFMFQQGSPLTCSGI
ncbi:MAG TPA: hypothetical protein PLF13_05235 [candidate division Zixibacteria bacterium]|nr:hypothetical protein [candidate division Zixibacteria bacterium]